MRNNVLDYIRVVPELYMGVECDGTYGTCGWEPDMHDEGTGGWYERLLEGTLVCPYCLNANHLKFWYVDESEWEEV